MLPNARSMGLISGKGTKILCRVVKKKKLKKKKKKERNWIRLSLLYFLLTFEHVTLQSDHHFMMSKESHFIKVQLGCMGQGGNPHLNGAVLGCNSIWLCGNELAARWK